MRSSAWNKLVRKRPSGWGIRFTNPACRAKRGPGRHSEGVTDWLYPFLPAALGRLPRRPFAHLEGVEAVERGADEVGQRLQVVATLEHGGDLRCERRRTLRQRAKPVRGQLHV